MCHPTGSGAGRNFCRGSFFVFLFLLSNVPPRAQADLPTKPTGNGLSSMPTNSAREEARELHHTSAVELAWLVLHSLEVQSLEIHSVELHSFFVMGMPGGACPGAWLGRGACPQPRAFRWFSRRLQPSASLATEARNHGGGAAEDPLGAWRGTCPGASPPRGDAIGIIVAARAALARLNRSRAAARAAVSFFSTIAAAAARAVSFFSTIAAAATRTAAATRAARRSAAVCMARAVRLIWHFVGAVWGTGTPHL